MMKKIALLGVLAAVILMTGCGGEDPKLTTCQQENADLQTQLKKASSTIEQNELMIAELKDKNTEVQKKALDSIRTMMEKQNAVTVAEKNKLKAEQEKVKELEKQIMQLEATVAAQKIAPAAADTAN